MQENDTIALPYNDYVQSANTLFHFMDKAEYLIKILKEHTIVPRYCIEDIEYLNVRVEEHAFPKIAVLQKCFCDIPFHKLTDTFSLNGVGKVFESLSENEKMELAQSNSPPDYYGKYAIALSKKWGESHHLQPVQYINTDSAYAHELSRTLSSVLGADDISEEYANDILRRISYIKPLRGTMNRDFESKSGGTVKVKIRKNFHDEREWRFVPGSDLLAEVKLYCIIANPTLLALQNGSTKINQSLTSEQYRRIWLEFSYDDIRYIIVPDAEARLAIIDIILSIPDTQFLNPKNANRERYVLISKILVLNEVRRDW